MNNKYNYFFIATILLINKDAHAYLDPGTGSLILQSIIGALAAAGAFISIFWSKLKNFFYKKLNKTKKK